MELHEKLKDDPYISFYAGNNKVTLSKMKLTDREDS